MNKETKYPAWGIFGISWFIFLIFFLLALKISMPIFLPLCLLCAFICFISIFANGGYIASESGVTFWRLRYLRRHFDYGSIRSADVSIKKGNIRFGSTSFIFILTLYTKRGNYHFYDESLCRYDMALRKNKESQQALLEASDLMKLKKYIEERI